MVRPSQRREMARTAVEGGRSNIRHACQTFEVSETCAGSAGSLQKHQRTLAGLADVVAGRTYPHKEVVKWAKSLFDRPDDLE